MKPFTEKAYTTTQLDYNYSQTKILEMMHQIGINNVKIIQAGNDFVLEFLAQLRHNEGTRRVRINIPYTPELDDTLKQQQNKKNVLFRVLFYHLKDKFVAINRGLQDFETAFLADLVIVENGKQIRLGDLLVPRYKKALENNKNKIAVLNIKASEKQ